MHSFGRANPKSGVAALSWKLSAALPHPSLSAPRRFSGDTAVGFSQALLELSHGLTGRGRAESEEREKARRRARNLEDKQRSSLWRNFVYLNASPCSATPR